MSQEGNETREEHLGKVSVDLLSLPPLINRLIRRKLIMTTILDDDVDLKLPHFEIMRVLADEGTMHPAKIGDKLLIAKAQMTQLIDRLVEFGFVIREMDSTDRRTFNITLTDHGRRLLDEQDNMVICAVTDVMASLSEKELESLSYNLRTLRDILFKLQ
jgi:DNA-binding MarR family transcriptional regulator